MNRDDIIRMAREAGLEVHPRKEQVRVGIDALMGIDSTEKVERFAALVAAAERETCAKVCDAEAKRALWNWDNDISGNQLFWNGGEQLASRCAAAIRARGQV